MTDSGRPTRREAVRLLLALGLAAALQGHTPYAQWTIYRKRNLFVVASRTDERATALARAVAEGFAAELPNSHARFTRATDSLRVASLLKTGQIEIAVIGGDEAAPMLAGAAAYASVGPVPLRLLGAVGDHLLVTVAAFRDRHAFLLAQALDRLEERLALPRSAAIQIPPLPFHPGALAYRKGKPLPGDEGEPEPQEHAHPHPR